MALWGISQVEDFGDLLLPIVNPEDIDRLLPFCQNLRSMKFASIPYHIRDRGVFVQRLFMKKKAFYIFLAISIGIVSRYFFYMIYGMVANFDIENQLSKWICIIPSQIKSFSFYVHGFLTTTISLLMTLFFPAVIQGIVAGRPIWFNTLLIFLGSVGFDIVYYQYILCNFSLFLDSLLPVWNGIIVTTIWFLIVSSSLFLGVSLKEMKTDLIKHRS